MGSYASLDLESIELLTVKNTAGYWNEYFTSADRKLVPYFYGDRTSQGRPKSKRRPALVAKLKDIRRLLELKGIAESNANPYFYSTEGDLIDKEISLSMLKRLCLIDAKKIKKTREWHDDGVGSFLYPDEELSRMVEMYRIDPISCFPTDNLLFALLANPKNANVRLIWRYYDVVSGGWAEEAEVLKDLDKSNPQILIITEGSSDTYILKKALTALEPRWSNLFDFIDMSENYPFTGTGNLLRFCQGLAKIKHSNKVIVIFDNDTEGVSKYEEVKRIDLQKNIRPILLPPLNEGKTFLTVGPNKKYRSDINGSALSIEHFLDLKFNVSKKPVVRWISYDGKMKRYQGALENKDEYVRTFLKMKDLNPKYNYSKLKYLVDYLFKESAALHADIQMGAGPEFEII